eukprot:1468835-Pyramimonas_sp.AAC.1
MASTCFARLPGAPKSSASAGRTRPRGVIGASASVVLFSSGLAAAAAPGPAGAADGPALAAAAGCAPCSGAPWGGAASRAASCAS